VQGLWNMWAFVLNRRNNQAVQRKIFHNRVIILPCCVEWGTFYILLLEYWSLIRLGLRQFWKHHILICFHKSRNGRMTQWISSSFFPVSFLHVVHKSRVWHRPSWRLVRLSRSGRRIQIRIQVGILGSLSRMLGSHSLRSR